jgi:hypothetical protein
MDMLRHSWFWQCITGMAAMLSVTSRKPLICSFGRRDKVTWARKSVWHRCMRMETWCLRITSGL